MLSRAKVRGRMFISRIIATTNMTARKTRAQMYPLFAALLTLFTALRCRRDDSELLKVGASFHADLFEVLGSKLPKKELIDSWTSATSRVMFSINVSPAWTATTLLTFLNP